MRIYKTIFGKLSAAKQISGTIQAVQKLEASLTIPKIEELKTYSYDGVDSVTGTGYSRVDHTVTVKASGLSGCPHRRHEPYPLRRILQASCGRGD